MDIRFLGTVPADAGFLSLSFGGTPGACPACSGRFLPPFFLGGVSWQRIRYQACQIPLVQHAQLMERTGRRHIQKLCMSVIHRIFLPGGIQDEHCVKFQSLRIFHRKDHDSAAEFSLLQIAFHDGDVFSNSLAAAAAFSRFLHTTAMVSKPFACQSLQTLAAFFISRAVSVTSDTFTGSP